MFGDAYKYKEGEITIIPDNDTIRGMKDRVRGKEPLLAKNLFYYRHNIHGNFVVAEWIGRPKLYYIDKINLGKKGLANLTREEYDKFLRRSLEPMTAQEVMQMTNDEEYKFLTMQQEDQAEEKERLEKIARGEF